MCKSFAALLSAPIEENKPIAVEKPSMELVAHPAGAIVESKPLTSMTWHLRQLAGHRTRYSALGKAEWWWIFDDTLADVAACLQQHSMVWLDGFVLPSQAAAVRSEVARAKDAGMLKLGVLGGGKLGSTLGYVHERVRGDLMQWFNGDEPECGWDALPHHGKKVLSLCWRLI